MSSQPPILRGAPFVNLMDLVRSTPRQSFASEQAKQMMGAGNPLSGKDIRKPASTYCSSCHRWHRPGTPCPNTLKALDPEILIVKGKIITTKPKRGNPYHDAATGRFASAPGSGEAGKAGGGKPPYDTSGLEGHYAQDQIMREAYREAKDHGATDSQAMKWAGNQAYGHKPPKNFSVPGREVSPEKGKKPSKAEQLGQQVDDLKQQHKAGKISTEELGQKVHEATQASREEPSPVQKLLERVQSPDYQPAAQQQPQGLTPEHLQSVLAAGVDPQQVISQMTPEQQQTLRQAAESGGETIVPPELAPYFAAFHQQPEYRQQWAQTASPEALRTAGKIATQQPQLGTAASAGFSAGQSIGAGMATPGGTATPTVQGLRRTAGLLQTPPQQQVPTAQPTPREHQQALETGSQQLQQQQQGYFDRLRQWLGRFGGGQ